MPFKFNQPRRHHIKPPQYKATNWKAYNEGLKQRGSLTVWLTESAIRNWHAPSNGKAHGQKLYSNLAIETAATIRLIFKLPLRQTTGLLQSITQLMKLDLPIPNFSTLSRRIKSLNVTLCKPSLHKAGTHIIIDGSGLSVHRAKETFKVKQKDMEKKGYRRIHIAINEHQEITACELTTLHGNEKKQVPKLLRKIHDHYEVFLADKNYDGLSVYNAIKKYRPTRFVRKVKRDTYTVIIPPRSNVKIRRCRGKFPLERSRHAAYIKSNGIINWQKKTGYGKRALVETAFSRYKRIFGRWMQNVNLANQQVEARLACKALNTMSILGLPQTVKIA